LPRGKQPRPSSKVPKLLLSGEGSEEAKTNNALDTKLSTRSEYGDVQSITFHENKLGGASVVRTEFDSFQGVYCSEEFKSAVENADLKGIIFSTDLGNIYPPDDTVGSPIQH